MATAVRFRNGVIDVRVPDADWGLESSTDKVPYNNLQPGPKIHSIEFMCGATGDSCLITENSAAGPKMAFFKANPSTTLVAQAPLVKYFHGRRFRPFIDVSEGAFSAGSSVIIIVE